MVDGTRIITVSFHLDNLEQTLNSHYSLRRPWRWASNPDPSLRLEFISHVKIQDRGDLSFADLGVVQRDYCVF